MLATIFSAIFGAGAIWLSRILSIGSGRFILLLSGIFLIFIAGFCMYAYYLLAKENFAAVYVSDEGVIDISTGNHIGTVLWKDVENIKIMDDLSNLKHKYIVIKVRNPKEYIDREPNHSKKRTLELKLQYYGSPICFSNRALDCTFEELKDAVISRFNSYRKNHPPTT